MNEYDYSGYKWIKVKHHKWEEGKTWEENYKDLEAHHIAETQFLIEEVRKLSKELKHPDYSKVRGRWRDDDAEIDRRFH